MEVPKSIADAIVALGRRNKTEARASELLKWLRGTYRQCEDDYTKTSTIKRYSTGKLEKKIFLYLADICQWENGNDNARQAGDIMIMLGYKSYQVRPHRFRQKVENEKKKKGGKSGYRGKAWRHRPRARPRADSSDDYCSDMDTVSETESNSSASSQCEPNNALAPLPVSVPEPIPTPVGFSMISASISEATAFPVISYPAESSRLDALDGFLLTSAFAEELTEVQLFNNKDSVFSAACLNDIGYDDELLAGLIQPLNNHADDDTIPAWSYDNTPYLLLPLC